MSSPTTRTPAFYAISARSFGTYISERTHDKPVRYGKSVDLGKPVHLGKPVRHGKSVDLGKPVDLGGSLFTYAKVSNAVIVGAGVVNETRKVPLNVKITFLDEFIHIPNGNIKYINRQSLKSLGHTSGEFVLFPNLPNELQIKIVALVPAAARDIHLVEVVDSSGRIWFGFPNNPGLPTIFQVSKLFYAALLVVKYKIFWRSQHHQVVLGPDDVVVMHSDANGPGNIPMGVGGFNAVAVCKLEMENWLFSANVATWENHSLDRLEKLTLVFPNLFWPGLSVRKTDHMTIKKAGAGGVFDPVCDHAGDHFPDGNCAIRKFCGEYEDATRFLLDPVSRKLIRLVELLNQCLSRGVHMPAVVVVRFEYEPVSPPRPLFPPPVPPNSPANGPTLGLGI